jgi:hypothetical protein
MAPFEMGRSWAYARVRVLARVALLEQKQLLCGQPVLCLRSAEGLRWRSLQRLGVYELNPASTQHSPGVAGDRHDRERSSR